ncbi:hypothetical protein [Candidatus Regiella endosymbiont of Tuberolachnus salignus]|uniref:hypothetical protein n=1 Tax=Candidatus Regiella endosymbiont of Tuberolachnus salignus TaxID=3077956 RepID=UPI0030CFEF91
MTLVLKKTAIILITVILWLSGSYSAVIADPETAADSNIIPGTRMSKETARIQGRKPTISAPSTHQPDMADISRVSAVEGKFTPGDTLKLIYDYYDEDGDVDKSIVNWFYTLEGVDYPIPDAVNTLADHSTPGSSMVTLPPQAEGASAIKARIQVASAYGYPNLGKLITINEMSQSNVHITEKKLTMATGGIFLATDNPHAGSGAQDYTLPGAPNLIIGETYLFRAWIDNNKNRIWDVNETDITRNLKEIQWILNGNNVMAVGNKSPSILDKRAVSGAITDQYTIPINSRSKSGALAGDQGFNLMVEFN